LTDRHPADKVGELEHSAALKNCAVFNSIFIAETQLLID
jgi:hypothetical protein